MDRDLIDGYLDDEYKGVGLCECFTEGQEIVIEDYSGVPEGFCPSAWADIRNDLFCVAMGADIPGIRQAGTAITSCHDWFRPVLFRIERIGDE
jgi:uncharacterized repeat protein (TIGR04076 family)